ncbi:MAG: hypothetical protein ABFC63_12275 [Thermoguttaceae bacterium]
MFCLVDDKHIPVHRILWISELPHFCGSEECQREGQYEIRLEHGESVWGNLEERDAALAAVRAWGEQST